LTDKIKIHHRKEFQLSIAVAFIVVIAILGMGFRDLVTLSDFIGINNLQTSISMLFEEGFSQFGILAGFVYGFLPITLMKLGITGIIVRILDAGVSPFFLVLFFSLGRLVGQAILYTIGRYIYRIFKGKDKDIAGIDHLLHKYKYLIYVVSPLLGSVNDIVMLVSGHERIDFKKIAPLLYIGNVISGAIWIYWTVITINLPNAFP
jgi:membrane protein DedA with SNARE-associated domain